jgi:hypothetical protein
MNFIIENIGNINKEKDPLKIFGTSGKLIGLKRQTNSFVSVYISFVNNIENYDFMPIKDCQISLRKINENTGDCYIDQGIH